MSVLQTVHLSVANFAPQAIIHAVQNDTDRQVEMIIDDYILGAGATGKITFERSDFTHYEAPATFDLSNNSFTAEIDQALTRFGETKVQLKVDGNDGRVSTFTFLIYVQRDTAGVATEQSAVDIKDAIEAAEAAVSHYPYIDPETRYWFVWDVERGEFVDTGVYAGGNDDKFYVHNQPTASSVWTIAHNLSKYPAVSITDSAGSGVIGDVRYVDENNLVVTFSAAFSGKAYMN